MIIVLLFYFKLNTDSFLWSIYYNMYMLKYLDRVFKINVSGTKGQL